MLNPEEVVNSFIDSFVESTDGRSNKFFKKVKEDKQFYVDLVKLYYETKSAKKVSKLVGLDSKYINTILKKFNVSIFCKRMDKDVLDLIIKDKLNGLSLGQLKLKYNFSLESLKRNLNNAGIDTSLKNPFDNLSEELVEEYKTKQLKELSKKYKVGVRTIKKYLLSKGVSIRTLSQSVSLNIKNKGVNFRGENINFKSNKNGSDILANSSYELARFLELEKDSSVLYYTKDVETICYNDCNNNYTADIYIEYVDGRKVVEEVKPNWYLNYMKKVLSLVDYLSHEQIAEKLNISIKSINKFIMSDLKFKEARSYFIAKGIEYKIITEDDIDIKLAQQYLKTK
jgi:hypothetical protein